MLLITAHITQVWSYSSLLTKELVKSGTEWLWSERQFPSCIIHLWDSHYTPCEEFSDPLCILSALPSNRRKFLHDTKYFLISLLLSWLSWPSKWVDVYWPVWENNSLTLSIMYFRTNFQEHWLFLTIHSIIWSKEVSYCYSCQIV